MENDPREDRKRKADNDKGNRRERMMSEKKKGERYQYFGDEKNGESEEWKKKANICGWQREGRESERRGKI